MLHLRRLALGSLSFRRRQLTRHRATNLRLIVAASLAPRAALRFTLCLRSLGAAERAPVEVKDGETLALTDGTVVRLINAKAPAAPLSWRGDQSWPLVNESKESLSQLASGAEVELRYGGTRTARHGYVLAQVYAVKGNERVWLQGELVAKGLAPSPTTMLA
jgi:endonuclease YncB( thermonuclease family)